MANTHETGETAGPSRPVVTFIFWLCIAATALIVVAIIKFYFDYSEKKDNIKGRAVMLTGVTPPDEDVSVPEARKWLDRFAAATPNCLCTIGNPAKDRKNSVLLFCVGFETGSESCSLAPEKLPESVTMTASNPSDIDTDLKLIFLLQSYAPSPIVSPRTQRPIQPPGDSPARELE